MTTIRSFSSLALLLAVAGVASSAQTQSNVRTSGVFVLQIDDVSGTMRRHLEAVAASQTAQYERSLRPGDGFARLEFDCSARIAQLMDFHRAEDIVKLATVLSEVRQAQGDTCVSEGLALARRVLEQHGGGRRAVLIVTTDAELDPGNLRPLAEEQARTYKEAAWWGDQPDVQKILVAVERGPASRRGLSRLAETLDATVVRLDDFASANVIERGVNEAREMAIAAANPIPEPSIAQTAPPAPNLDLVLPLALAGVTVLALVCWSALARSRSESRPMPLPVQTLPSAEPARSTREILVSITARGRTTRTICRLPDVAGSDRVTFGESGSVVVPGLSGMLELFADPDSDQLMVQVPSATSIWIDGRQTPPEGGTFTVRRGFTLRGRVFVNAVVNRLSADRGFQLSRVEA